MLAVPFALAGPAPEAGAVVAVLLVACALVARSLRLRALAMAGALVLAPVLLVADIWDSPQLHTVRDHPGPALVAALLAVAVVCAAAWLVARRPLLLPLMAVFALPFRIPIQVSGETSNLLVPLYFVVAVGVVAFIVPALRRDPELPEPTRTWSPGWMERLLALAVVLYGVQAVYSADFDRALQQIAFFYVPFALLFVLLAQVEWTPRLLKACFALLVGLALVFSGIGLIEYATRHIFLNPKLVASNELHTYFRTNSVFFDPNIYGRFLVVAMLAVAAAMLRTTSGRLLLIGSAVLVWLWGGLVLTLSQSSFVALLIGLATLAVLQWGARRILLPAAAVVVVVVVAVLVTPGTFGVNLHNLDASSSGRTGLVSGGADMFAQRPLQGYGSGSFEKEYVRHHQVNSETAVASHTIPVTIGAEQGLLGLLSYVALLAAAFVRLLRGAAGSPARTAIGAAFVALIVHTLIYAAFLEDPLTWALLGIGSALAAAAPAPALKRRRRPTAQAQNGAPLQEPRSSDTSLPAT